MAGTGPRDWRLVRFVRAFLRQQLAAVAPMMALLLVPLVGGVAYAVEQLAIYAARRPERR